MNVLVLFGSKSDEFVYAPLCESLKDHNVMMEVISAHRKPEELGTRLAQDDYDFVIAGAGIAAHLPGVVASKISKPVVGVPVASQLGGLDALLSIVQMPFGVPVLTVGVDNEKDLNNYLAPFCKINELSNLTKINVVCQEKHLKDEYVQKELQRFSELAKDNNYEVAVTEEIQTEQLNIVYVVEEKDIYNDNKAVCINTPIFSTQQKQDARESLRIQDWTRCGGLWVGVNNSRNALLTFNKWRA